MSIDHKILNSKYPWCHRRSIHINTTTLNHNTELGSWLFIISVSGSNFVAVPWYSDTWRSWTHRHKPTGCKINSGQTVYVKMSAEREGGDRTNRRGASPLATVLRSSASVLALHAPWRKHLRTQLHGWTLCQRPHRNAPDFTHSPAVCFQLHACLSVTSVARMAASPDCCNMESKYSTLRNTKPYRRGVIIPV